MRNASAAKKEGNGIKKRKSKQERRFFLLGLLFVSPWLIGFLCFQLYPILSALYYRAIPHRKVATISPDMI